MVKWFHEHIHKMLKRKRGFFQSTTFRGGGGDYFFPLVFIIYNAPWSVMMHYVCALSITARVFRTRKWKRSAFTSHLNSLLPNPKSFLFVFLSFSLYLNVPWSPPSHVHFILHYNFLHFTSLLCPLVFFPSLFSFHSSSLSSLHPGCADDSRALMASVCCSPACLCVISSSPALLHTLSPRLSAPFFSQTAAQLPRCQLTVAVNSHTILCIAKADCVWRASN